MPEPFSPPDFIEFYGCQIACTRDALIPRVETEFLPDFILPKLKKGMVVWDICCGTGCLGLAIKKNFPDCTVILSDISPQCVSLAMHNAQVNGLDVEVRCGDLIEPFAGEVADIVICNPPYVTEQEYLMLDASVRDYDPKLALVSGPTGLEFYERLKKELYFKTQIFLEIGAGQGVAIQKIFGGGEVLKDLASHDRYFILET